MNVTIRLFARARDLAGGDSVPLSLPQNASVGQLRTALCEAYPALKPMQGVLLIAIDNDYATDETPVPNGAEIACFPPVSGG